MSYAPAFTAPTGQVCKQGFDSQLSQGCGHGTGVGNGISSLRASAPRYECHSPNSGSSSTPNGDTCKTSARRAQRWNGQNGGPSDGYRALPPTSAANTSIVRFD